jgi:hypothetical protein
LLPILFRFVFVPYPLNLFIRSLFLFHLHHFLEVLAMIIFP